MKIIDMRSDTVTLPTDEMRSAMAAAELGDDVYGCDPTINELEAYAAELVKKEAALFVPSGTFGNQLSLFSHCARGSEVILGDDCHIVQHEAGASAIIAGVQLRTVESDGGALPLELIKSKIRESNDYHCPKTGAICLENAHSNGRVLPLEYMERIADLAKEHGIPTHLDGARVFNAAAYLNTEAAEICRHVDSVMFCLSKGLCAPVGSMLAGSRDFIEKARRGRKIMGGGMRQAGVLGAAGLIALKKMTSRLTEDHSNAKLLGLELEKIEGIKINTDDIHINMVFFTITTKNFDSERFMGILNKKGIWANPPENRVMRFVTHYWIKEEDILYVSDAVREALCTAGH